MVYILTMNQGKVIPALILVVILFGRACVSHGSVAVLPFRDLSTGKLDPSISSVIQAELSKAGIDVVPVDLIMEEVMEMGPWVLWKEGGEEGILIEMERKRKGKAEPPLSADTLVYGDRARFGEVVRVNIYLKKRGSKEAGRVFTVEGREGELLKGLKAASREIARLILSREALKRGEEYIRGYRGGIHTYGATLKALKGLVEEWGTFPLRVLYLSMLLEREMEREEEIIEEGRKVLEAYDPMNEEDLRFLMSLGLDPFDAVARAQERRKALEEAIEVREKALEVFPLNRERHRVALGKDYYLLALSMEREGHRERARDLYRKALLFLPETTEEYKRASERLRELTP